MIRNTEQNRILANYSFVCNALWQAHTAIYMGWPCAPVLWYPVLPASGMWRPCTQPVPAGSIGPTAIKSAYTRCMATSRRAAAHDGIRCTHPAYSLLRTVHASQHPQRGSELRPAKSVKKHCSLQIDVPVQTHKRMHCACFATSTAELTMVGQNHTHTHIYIWL